MQKLNFDSKSVGKVEVSWWQAHNIGDKQALMLGLVQHNAELYGLTMEEAQSVVQFMAQAVKAHDTKDWDSAIAKMTSAYEIIKVKLGASFGPAEAARQEVGWWELHDELEFVEDKTPLAQAFANLFALVFEVSSDELAEAGKLKAEATRQHDLAEADGVDESVSLHHWEQAEKNLVAFYEHLKSVVNA